MEESKEKVLALRANEDGEVEKQSAKQKGGS